MISQLVYSLISGQIAFNSKKYLTPIIILLIQNQVNPDSDNLKFTEEKLEKTLLMVNCQLLMVNELDDGMSSFLHQKLDNLKMSSFFANKLDKSIIFALQ